MQLHYPGLRIARGTPFPLPRHNSGSLHLHFLHVEIPLAHSYGRSPCPVKISPVPHLIVVETYLHIRARCVNSESADASVCRIGQIPRVVAGGNCHLEVVAVPLTARGNRNLAVESVNEVLLVGSLCIFIPGFFIAAKENFLHHSLSVSYHLAADLGKP